MPSVPRANQQHEDPEQGRYAVRRVTDRCFFEAEEVVHGPDGSLEGYIVEGVLVSADEIAEVREMCNDSDACSS